MKENKSNLYLITFNGSFYSCARNLSVIAKRYPNAKKIESLGEIDVLDSDESYDLLKEAYKFITMSPNTLTNDQRLYLENKIKTYLESNK